MKNTDNLKKGAIFSETQFYVVKEVEKDSVIVTDEFQNDIRLTNNYVNDLLSSADNFSSEEKKNMTELADIFRNSRGIAMTVAFFKKDTKKTAKQFKAEVAEWTENVKNAFINEGVKGLEKYATEPVSDVVKGELRVMKGRHYGQMDDLGRVHFVDMEQIKDASKPEDTRMRQVDPRTIQYVIVNNVKYVLK